MCSQMGFLVLEILRGSYETKNFLARNLRPLSRSLGDVILHGNNEILKLIAGSIMREMIDSGFSTKDFFQSDPGTIASIEFPELKAQASQWTTDLIDFVDQLDTQGLLTQERAPATFAYAVSINDTVYSTETGLSILVTVSDELTVMIPTTTRDTVKCIDIPLRNVVVAKVELGGPGSQQQSSQASKPAILTLELGEHAGAAYYINELKRPPCKIHLAFDTVADANAIKDRIAFAGASHGSRLTQPEHNEEDTLFTLDQDPPAEILSQSHPLGVSKSATHQDDTPDGFGPLEPPPPRSTNLTAPAVKANATDTLGSKSNPPSREELVISSNGNERAKHAMNLAARSQLTTREKSDGVGQEIGVDPNPEHEVRNPVTPSLDRRRSSSVWHDGLDAIENDPVLQPELANRSEISVAAPPISNDNDDDLYLATPRGPKTQSNVNIDGADNSKPAVKKKVSQSMRVGEGERLSTLPSTVELLGKNQGTNSGKKRYSSAPGSRDTNKKTAKKRAATPKTKTKGESLPSKMTISNGENSMLAGVFTDETIFDLPESPPDRRKLGVKSKKRGVSKSKAPKSTKIGPTANMTRKPLGSKAGNSKAVSKSKPTRESDEKMPENSEAGSYDPMSNDDHDIDAKRRSGNSRPADRGSKKAKSQAASKERKTTSSRVLKNESTTTKPKSSLPTRRSQGKRVAAQKAKEQIHNQFSDAYEGESPHQESQSIDNAGLTETRRAAESVSANDDAMRDVLESIAKEILTTEEVVDGEVALAPFGAPDSPASTRDDLGNQHPVVAETLATNPSGAVNEHESSHQDRSPISRDIPSPAAASAFDTIVVEAVNDEADGTKNNVIADNENLIFPDDEPVLHDPIQHEATSMNNMTGLLMGDDEDIGNVNNPIEGRERVNTVEQVEKAAAVPLGPDDVINIVPAKTNQIALVQDPKTTGSPQMLLKADAKVFDGPRIGSQKVVPAKPSPVAAGPVSEVEAQAQLRTTKRLDKTDGPEQRTSSTNLNSGLHNDFSGMLDVDDAIEQSTDTPQVKHQARVQQSSNHERVEEDPKTTGQASLSPRNEESTKIGRDPRNLARSQLKPDTMRPRRKDLHRTGHAAGPSNSSANTPGIDSLPKPESETYIVTSGPSSDPSSEPRSVDGQNDAPSITQQHPIEPTVTNLDGKQSSIPPTSMPAQRLSSKDEAKKKRPRDPEGPNPSKRIKLHSSKSLKHAPDSISTGHGLFKDPDRKPQIISFGPQGPRNQGLASPERSTRHETHADDIRTKELTRGRSQKRKSDVEVDFKDDSDHAQFHTEERPRLKKVRIEDGDHAQARAAHNLEQHARNRSDSKNHQSYDGDDGDRRPLAAQQPRTRIRGPLPAHSSILADDFTQHVSSQGSRVDENGSPLPVQRTLPHRSPAVKGKFMDDNHSDFENFGLPLIDDETTLVQTEMNEDAFGQPIRACRGVRRSEADVARSSNSKHVPSSPTAPSAIMTGIQADTIKSGGGRMVNFNTDTVLIPATPYDPFTSPKAQRPNRFLERLRGQFSNTKEQDVAAVAKGNVKSNAGRPDLQAIDPDITLVEADRPKHKSKQRRRVAPLSSDPTDPSSSPQSFHSSQGSSADNEAHQRWRDALKPHQKETLDILYELSHELVGHLMDKETACNDVVNDFQRRGTRFVENLNNDLEREASQYETTNADRRSKELARLQKLQAHVTKNLDRSPVAEKVARRFEEDQRLRTAKWEEAMKACEEMEQ
ncbi:MAG: hypothetical protein Q9168_007425 [Polycauliona sp. 1 TL-2023]